MGSVQIRIYSDFGACQDKYFILTFRLKRFAEFRSRD